MSIFCKRLCQPFLTVSALGIVLLWAGYGSRGNWLATVIDFAASLHPRYDRVRWDKNQASMQGNVFHTGTIAYGERLTAENVAIDLSTPWAPKVLSIKKLQISLKSGDESKHATAIETTETTRLDDWPQLMQSLWGHLQSIHVEHGSIHWGDKLQLDGIQWSKNRLTIDRAQIFQKEILSHISLKASQNGMLFLGGNKSVRLKVQRYSDKPWIDMKVVLPDLSAWHHHLKHDGISGKGLATVRWQPNKPLQYRAAATHWSVEHPVIHSKPVPMPSISVSGRVAPGNSTGKFVLADKHSTMKSRGSWTVAKDQLSIRLAQVDCNTLVSLLPTAVRRPIQDFQFRGSFEFHAGPMQRDTAIYARTLIKAARQWKKSCKISRSPLRLSPVALKDISRNLIHAGEIEALKNPHLVKAVIASEDRNFWHHQGVDFPSMQFAVQATLNSASKKIGASTITMQLVKNLFLKRQRTVSRKIPEVFLAYHLENFLSKGEILGQYMRVAEFGPGLFGITRAALEYFGKSPAQLTLKESVWLAYLLPAPQRRFRTACAGHLSVPMEKRINNRIKDLYRAGKISKTVMRRSAASRLQFQTSSPCLNSMETTGHAKNDDLKLPRSL